MNDDNENPDNLEPVDPIDIGDSAGDDAPQEHSSYQVPKDKKLQLSGMYESWFLDYASYVILERAVPHIENGRI